VLRHEQLRERTTGIDADHVRAGHLEGVQDLDQQPGEPGRGQVRVLTQRHGVRPQG